MNLTKALKHKKKLVKQADEMFIRFSKYNSQPVGFVGYDPAQAYESWLKLTNELVDLKTKIHIANQPIAHKIFRLGELKNLISRLRNVETKSGSFKEFRYSEGESVEYVAFLSLFEKDEQIQFWEAELETLQEQIEAFNAITKI
jgi:queuine/archaeosine tRNA-ribosyltransferase